VTPKKTGPDQLIVCKQGHDGTVEKNKASLVVKGFKPKPSPDYEAIYTPVHRSATLRTGFAYVAAEWLDLWQLVVKTALLNDELDGEIFLLQ
jgi:hypothetical protein